MNIQEVERKSGLDRANIRFYEKEGLLTPERKANGYRDYSEDDLQLLMKIKLLRQLGFSLVDIRSLKEGNSALEEAVARRLEVIGAQRKELDAAEQVCHEMRQDGAQFSTLDARHYLDSYNRAVQALAASSLYTTATAGDRIPFTRIPWRRYFARGLDLSIVSLVVNALLAIVFRVNILEIPAIVEWILGYVEWALLIPLEALLLSRFGTTPGKWIMGIRLEHADGRNLTFSHAAQRAWEVFARGYGYNIPFYNIYRFWKSYKEVSEGDGPEWDYEVVITDKEFNGWRVIGYIAASALVVVLVVWASLVPGMPVNRGDDLTVEEFVENYNKLADYYGIDDDGTLQTDGTFLQNDRSASTGVITSNGSVEERLVLQWTLDGDILTGVSFARQDMEMFFGLTPDTEGKTAILLSAMSYLWADTSMRKALNSQDILAEFISHREGTLTKDLLGCRLTYTITNLGESLAESGAWTEQSYNVSFHMERIN